MLQFPNAGEPDSFRARQADFGTDSPKEVFVLIKKMISVLLAAALILAAAACGKNTPEDKGQPGSQTEKEASSSSEKIKEESTEAGGMESDNTEAESRETESKKGNSTETESAEEKSTETEGTKKDTTETERTQGNSTELEKTEGQDTESEEEKTSSEEKSSGETEESGNPELHITDGLLLKYLVDRKVVHLVVRKDQEAGNTAEAPYKVFELTGLTKEMEEQLAPMLSGTHVQMIYTTDKEGPDPLPVVPGEILDLDADSETPDRTADIIEACRTLTELGYVYLVDSEVYPTFLLAGLADNWRDEPVTFEYSDDGRSVDVLYELKRDDGTEPFKFVLASFALLDSGDEPGGDIGYANIRLREDGPDYLYLGLPRYAYDYVAGNRDYYFYPEKGNWDNEVRVTLTDEELKTLIRLQTGPDDPEDYDALRGKYQKALEEDDTEAMTEVNHHLFRADEWLQKYSEENVSINGLKPSY